MDRWGSIVTNGDQSLQMGISRYKWGNIVIKVRICRYKSGDQSFTSSKGLGFQCVDFLLVMSLYIHLSPMSLVKMDSGGRLQRTSAIISDFKPPPLPVQVRLNFSNHTSPDVRVRTFQLLFLHNCFLWRQKSKNWVNRRIRRLTPVDILMKYNGLIVFLPVQIID